MTPPALEAVASAGAMTMAEVQQLVVGDTVLVRDEGISESRVKYFSPDGTVQLKAKPDAFVMIFIYNETYCFDDEGRFRMNYPSLPSVRRHSANICSRWVMDITSRSSTASSSTRWNSCSDPTLPRSQPMPDDFAALAAELGPSASICALTRDWRSPDADAGDVAIRALVAPSERART